MDVEKIAQIITESDLQDKIDSFEKYEDLQAFFAEKGIDLTIEEVQKVVSEVAALDAENGEISADAADAVTGGATISISKAIGAAKGGWNAGKAFAKAEAKFTKWLTKRLR